MVKLILLGTAHAIPSQDQDNSHMLLVGETRRVLIDTSTNPIVRLGRAGIDPNSLTDVILTHFHPDHVSGLPHLLISIWLLGRVAPLNIYSLADTLDRVEKMMLLFGWQYWPNFYKVNLLPVAETELAPVLQCPEFDIFASPVRHMVPNIGLRIDFHSETKSLAYSCDTEPTQEVVRLAAGCDYLLHEATGAEQGHSSAAQAGEIARQAEVGKLILIHYDPQMDDPASLVEQAQTTFGGPIELARDFMEIEF